MMNMCTNISIASRKDFKYNLRVPQLIWKKQLSYDVDTSWNFLPRFLDNCTSGFHTSLPVKSLAFIGGKLNELVKILRSDSMN